MGTLTCRCGHPVKTANEGTEAYSADALPQRSWEALRAELASKLHSLVEAIRQGQTAAQWAGVEISDAAGEESLVLYHLFQESLLTHSRSLYQCEVCSRLYVETSTPHAFRSFLPESDDCRGIWEGPDRLPL